MINTSLLNNFDNDLNVAVIGASGGIGQAFTRLLIQQDNVKNIYALSRTKIDFKNQKVVSMNLDLRDVKTIEAAAETLNNQTLDIIIIATGLLHDDTISPEKSIRDITFEQMHDIFAINTFGPTMVAKYFLPLLPKDKKSVFAALSARVGSIEDNRLGGWYSYRASKAALNMMIKNFSIEFSRRYKQASIIGLHPGTVDTDLSNPFKANVTPDHLFTPDYSAAKLLGVINDATPENSGYLFAWDGEIIPY